MDEIHIVENNKPICDATYFSHAIPIEVIRRYIAYRWALNIPHYSQMTCSRCHQMYYDMAAEYAAAEAQEQAKLDAQKPKRDEYGYLVK